MADKKYDFLSHEQTKEIDKMIADADALDVSILTQMNNVRYFLKVDQNKLKVNEPSVAAAEIQMKALASHFNDRREQIEKAIVDVTDMIRSMAQHADKLTNMGHAGKGAKILDASAPLEKRITEMNDIISQLNDAKKEQLEDLKKSILKAEKIRHFKNLQ